MFTSMQFEWPPVLLKLYNGLSLVNFNLELLAPECNFTVNYEQKWFVTQLLPLILGGAILVVLVATKVLQWIQRVVFRVLPFGATSDTNLVDTCIGIFITGVFHLYLCEASLPCTCACVSVCHRCLPLCVCCSRRAVHADAVSLHRPRRRSRDEGRADDPVQPRGPPRPHGQHGEPVVRAVRPRRPLRLRVVHVAVPARDRRGPEAARAGQG
jgi:hypothetical protein